MEHRLIRFTRESSGRQMVNFLDIEEVRRFVQHSDAEPFGTAWMHFAWMVEQALIDVGWARRDPSGGVWATPRLTLALSMWDRANSN